MNGSATSSEREVGWGYFSTFYTIADSTFDKSTMIDYTLGMWRVVMKCLYLLLLLGYRGAESFPIGKTEGEL
ncbi:hypothetical protein KSF_111950 [Reticulibacter mediterranei]|uniref:Uncharacterized protein n=1 Tax=Reticulibacter mediterranei TaxID=2778369 RepID=A0A8J3NB63_9CHLR|nr:hypothetical protein KSF_111950 [Reticulibacter mediterranei]